MQVQPRTQAVAPPIATALREFLAFKLGAEEYGIDILRVQEIRSYEAPTRIANAPRCVKGVVNLRGVIVPIVDRRDRLGCLEAVDGHGPGGTPVIIVLDFGTRVIGVVVDAVSDVIAVQADQIKAAPQLTSGDTTFISGIACSRQGDDGSDQVQRDKSPTIEVRWIRMRRVPSQRIGK